MWWKFCFRRSSFVLLSRAISTRNIALFGSVYSASTWNRSFVNLKIPPSSFSRAVLSGLMFVSWTTCEWIVDILLEANNIIVGKNISCSACHLVLQPTFSRPLIVGNSHPSGFGVTTAEINRLSTTREFHISQPLFWVKIECSETADTAVEFNLSFTVTTLGGHVNWTFLLEWLIKEMSVGHLCVSQQYVFRFGVTWWNHSYFPKNCEKLQKRNFSLFL